MVKRVLLFVGNVAEVRKECENLNKALRTRQETCRRPDLGGRRGYWSARGAHTQTHLRGRRCACSARMVSCSMRLEVFWLALRLASIASCWISLRDIPSSSVRVRPACVLFVRWDLCA